MRHSYGILLYRYTEKGKIEVFLGHASSPRYWVRDQKKIWGIPKGRADKGEKPLQTAKREFLEEVGIPAPDLKYVKLCKYATTHKRRKKRITIFVANATGVPVEYDGTAVEQERYWPNKKRGVKVRYREMDDARWFSEKKAMKRVLRAQRAAIALFYAASKDKASRKEYQAYYLGELGKAFADDF